MKRWIATLLVSGFLMSWKTNNEEIVKVSITKIAMQTGKQSIVNVFVDVQKGYHIQANKIKNEYLVPTTLEIKPANWFEIKKQVFPATKKFNLEGTDESLDVYDGRFEIQTFLTTKRQAQKGIYNLIGKLKYQACDSARCLFPRTVDFSIDVEVH